MEQFRCTAYRTWLSRGSCSQRYRRANGAKSTLRGQAKLQLVANDSLCVGCEIGKAHRAGMVPEVETRTVGPHDSALGPGKLARRRPAPRVLPVLDGGRPDGRPGEHAPQRGAERQEDEAMSKDVMITHGGVTRPRGEWAKALGMSTQALQSRLDKGWSIEDALTIPKGGTPPKERHKRPKARNGASKRKPAPRPVRKSPNESETHAAVRAIASLGQASGPRALLERAGYVVDEVQTPKGVALFVEVA